MNIHEYSMNIHEYSWKKFTILRNVNIPGTTFESAIAFASPLRATWLVTSAPMIRTKTVQYYSEPGSPTSSRSVAAGSPPSGQSGWCMFVCLPVSAGLSVCCACTWVRVRARVCVWRVVLGCVCVRMYVRARVFMSRRWCVLRAPTHPHPQ